MPTPETTLSQITLVTGPARSGKSEWAESLATNSDKPVLYIATAQADPTDLEWQARIQQHRDRRPTQWNTLEVTTDLVSALASPSQACILVDSLGTWVANCLDQDEPTWRQTTHALYNCLRQTSNHIILVAEETGWGIVPAYPIGRLFRDRLGTLVRHIGAIAQPVYLVAGGYVLNLSALGSPLPDVSSYSEKP